MSERGRQERTLDARVRAHLERLRADFANVTGTGFEHFFCPILFRDDNVDLCKGHVLNQAFGVAMDQWTIQRKDVDNFFGSRFESDVTKLRYRDPLTRHNVMANKKLRRMLNPKVFVDDREVEYFIPQAEIPEYFTAVYSDDDQLPPVIGLKLHPNEVEKAVDADWSIEVSIDVRTGALVALSKAAYLTLFHLLGYRYVLSPAGHLIGGQLLRETFEKSHTLSPKDVQAHAEKTFASFKTMLRPLLHTSLGLQGTIVDRQVMVAWSASGFPSATIVIVPTGGTLLVHD